MTTEAQPCEVEIGDDADHFVAEAAQAVLDQIALAIRERGRAVIAVSGGSTPGPVYDRLSNSEADWAKVTVTLVDERLVDPASPDSNERLVRERLLRGPAAAARFVPLATDQLAALPLPFDLVLLGMGGDGHTASLFPGNPALAEGLTSAALCIEVPAGQGGQAPPQARRSLTLAGINAARRRILLIRGQDKIAVYRAALLSGDANLYPVAGVLNAPDNLNLLLCLV